MVKRFLIVISLLTSLGGYSAEGSIVSEEFRLKSKADYIIISNAPAIGVPGNKTRIKGVGKTKDGDFIKGASVGILGKEYPLVTDDEGKFEIIVNSTDTAIYYYHRDYQEILINEIDFQGGHEIVLEIFPKSNKKLEKSVPVVAYKPVIYVYAKERLDVDLKLEPKGKLTFTYPKYENGWSFKTGNSGSIQINDKTYPYLFWEGEIALALKQRQGDVTKGFLVQTDSIISFFENQLTAAGLNDRERADFITFWGPRLQTSPFVMIQFLVDDEYADQVASIAMSPNPESMRRIFMVYTPFLSKPKIKLEPQTFKPFKRKDFTVIEWGGSKINPVAL